MNKRALLRSQLFAGVETWRATFNAAEDDRNQIRQSYPARPATFHPPLVYIGDISETLRHSAGVKTIDQRASVVVVRGLYDNAEAVEWRDRAMWSLHEYLSDNHSLISTSTLLEPLGAEDTELDMGNQTIYLAGIVTVRHDVALGRD